MARPLRFVPANALVEVTTRTIQGRLLLKPSPELTDIILGVIGKAQDLYEMTIHAFVVVSNHAHFLLSPSSASQLAKLMQFVNANIAMSRDARSTSPRCARARPTNLEPCNRPRV